MLSVLKRAEGFLKAFNLSLSGTLAKREFDQLCSNASPCALHSVLSLCSLKSNIDKTSEASIHYDTLISLNSSESFNRHIFGAPLVAPCVAPCVATCHILSPGFLWLLALSRRSWCCMAALGLGLPGTEVHSLQTHVEHW